LHKQLLLCCIDVIDSFLLVLDIGELDFKRDILPLIGSRSHLFRLYQCLFVVKLELSNLDGEVLCDLTRYLFNIGVTLTVVYGDDGASCLTRGVDVLFKLSGPFGFALFDAAA